MLPSLFMTIETLPLTASGKINRRALPEPALGDGTVAPDFLPARNPVELELSRIWEYTLGIKPIGMRDSFFDLGADSISAVRVFARVSSTFGQPLSPASLFEAPTVEQQARLLSDERTTVRWTSLVPIQPRGDRQILFCVHGAAGTVLIFHGLAKYLGNAQPVYGLQAQGLYDATPPHTTIEEMANHYVQEIRTIQPHGPYSIAGFCFGGLVALQMAERLSQQGEKIDLLASINGPAPRFTNGIVQANDSHGRSRMWQSFRRVRAATRWNYVREAL